MQLRPRGRVRRRVVADPLGLDQLDVAAGLEALDQVLDHDGPLHGLDAPDEQPLVDHVEGRLPAPRGGEGRADVVLAEVFASRRRGEEGRANVDAVEVQLVVWELARQVAQPGA